jgi:hypothetical protein
VASRTMKPAICHPGNTLTTRPGRRQIRDWCYDQAYIATLELIRAEEIRIENQRWRGIPPFELSYEQVDDLITRAKVFMGTFFGLEREARRLWGEKAGRGIAYDPIMKGVWRSWSIPTS